MLLPLPMPKSPQRQHLQRPPRLMLPPLLLTPLLPRQTLPQPRLMPLPKHLLHPLQQTLACLLTTHTA
ncbi:hypothetical protein GCM10007907_30500 [Chitinimonas prasina]|uniref:Uncharacterized protein n=1 Tax=Chitinimonas prasina TaxID=1434937 RepID=A0ABQ5YLM7_9NEIS|nr:hypothetical protein GCM10007907_30500 [Chitinimonas prasina]